MMRLCWYFLFGNQDVYLSSSTADKSIILNQTLLKTSGGPIPPSVLETLVSIGKFSDHQYIHNHFENVMRQFNTTLR